MKIERLWQGSAITIVGTVELDTLEARIEALEEQNRLLTIHAAALEAESAFANEPEPERLCPGCGHTLAQCYDASLAGKIKCCPDCDHAIGAFDQTAKAWTALRGE